jgi:hypothetical protein
MGVCNNPMNRQALSSDIQEQTENEMTTFKVSGKDEYGQSLVISSKQLNIEIDPTKQYLHLYFELHRKEVDAKIFKFYSEVIIPNANPISDISFKMHELPKKQAKFLSSLISYCPQLVKLNLWQTSLSDTGLRYLTKSLPRLKNLEQLSLEQNSITQDGFIYFSKGLRHLTSLRILSLSGNEIGREGMKSLCIAFESCGMIEELYMHNDGIENDMLKTFVPTAEVLKGLKKLGLGYNKLDKGAVLDICAILQNENIEYLFLKGNCFDDDEADKLVADFMNVSIDL